LSLMCDKLIFPIGIRMGQASERSEFLTALFILGLESCYV